MQETLSTSDLRIFGEFWEGKRVFVTGSNGFIGSHLVKRLLDFKSDVHVILRPSCNTIRINKELIDLKIHTGDICIYDSVKRVIENSHPEIVFHLAAFGTDYRFSNDEDMLMTNIIGTSNLLNSLRDNDLYKIG